MYAAIRTYGGGDAFTDALQQNEDAIRGILTPIGGFRAYYIVRGSDGPTTVSVFDDQAGADESVQAAAAWVGENLSDVAPGAPAVTTGEVVASF